MILKPIIVIFAFLTLGLGSCTVHEQFVVRNRPRAPYADNQPPPPIGASVWIPAEWVWSGYQSTYTWHKGHWMRPRYGLSGIVEYGDKHQVGGIGFQDIGAGYDRQQINSEQTSI